MNTEWLNNLKAGDGEGISRAGDLLDISVEEGIMDKSGSWYSFEGERIGQGRENVKKFFLENQEVYNRMLSRVREAIGLDKKPETSQNS